MTNSISKVPKWFWVVASIMVLWNLMGLASFSYHVFITDEMLAAMPEKESALFDQYPLWTDITFGIAVFGGLLGAIGLLLRKRWSKILLKVSLIAILIQMSHSLFFTDSMDVYGPNTVIMPIILIVIAIFLILLAKIADMKGWLR